MDEQEKYRATVGYIRSKVDQLLTLMGTLPLRPEELDDSTLLELDPIGIVADSFSQVLAHLHDTNHALSVAKSEIRTILDVMGAAVVVLNDDNTIDDCNRSALAWFFDGADYAQVVGQRIDAICACGGGIEALLREGGEREREVTLGKRHLQVITSGIVDENGETEKSVFLYFDITRQKAIEASLQLYVKVFDHTAEGILISDRDNRIIEVNDAFCRITGYSADELLGKTPRVFRSGLHDQLFYRELWQSLREHGYWQGEIFDRTKAGDVIPLLQAISEVRDDNGNLTHHISVITDISSLKETQSRLDFLAHHDVLTKLPNRLLFNDRLNQAVERGRRDHSRFAVLFIDLDRFKTLNDSLGHHVGDRFLIEVANRLRGLVRKVDTVARLGGDEFVILVEQLSSPAYAQQLADKIVRGLKAPVTIDDRVLHIGCSIGLTLYPEDGEDAVSLLRNADAAMYRVKESGRDGYFKFSHDLTEAAFEKLTLENELRQAVEQHELVSYYQPIIDLQTQQVVAAEALLRWPREGGFVPPDKFIPIAEEVKLINAIGAQVTEQALRQLAAWDAAGIVLEYISINASGSQIFAPGFADGLIAELEVNGIDGSRLQVELTENVLMRDVQFCNTVLDRLRDHGVRIAIDDFGTGYSSLAYLKQLPIDTLKLDRSFVRDIPGDQNDCAIARAVIGLAGTLGLQAVAEGVETEDQEQFLTEAGCSTVQGFLYAQALPAEQFADYVSRFQQSTGTEH